ncbi:glycosyltransferase family 2 protein [Janthinobacterium psychrotolerans]|uniref:Rhamnosyltransferase n=1 Tax=Janthinobacterium psychrotolerans TaxID=1747903 RepID=A0A1A7BZW9_9BURK|nr:glycosyltransferase family 2 protein [Janthinobacterium psychrotolerans]OBV37628.1 rhamnosyltransferase [Janthinobacterium psychrotolerans]
MNNICSGKMDVVAIVVTYNPLLANVWRLTAALAAQVDKIIVVDNGSANIAQLRAGCENLPQIELLALTRNMGIAYAQNAGNDCARKAGAQYLIYFDQDSVITAQFVAPLKAAFLSLSSTCRVALVAPVFKDEKKDFFYPLVWFNRYGTRRKTVPTGKETNPIPVSIAISSGSFTSMAVMDDVGAMRSDFFIDYVDIEWCLRAVHAGYVLFAIPAVCMLHSIGDRSIPFLKWRLAIHSEWRRYYRIRNGFLLLRLPHVPKLLALREVVVNLVHQFILIVTQNNRQLQLKYLWRGVRDGLCALRRT